MAQTFIPTLLEKDEKRKRDYWQQVKGGKPQSNLELWTEFETAFPDPASGHQLKLRVPAWEQPPAQTSRVPPRGEKPSHQCAQYKRTDVLKLEKLILSFIHSSFSGQSEGGKQMQRRLFDPQISGKIFCNPLKNTMFTCLASASLKNVTRWVRRRSADDCSSNFLYSSASRSCRRGAACIRVHNECHQRIIGGHSQGFLQLIL